VSALASTMDLSLAIVFMLLPMVPLSLLLGNPSDISPDADMAIIYHQRMY
jgi:hypothetical protein